MFLMMSRFVDLKEYVTCVLEELGWDGLTLSQWRQLQAILLLLQPFAHQTNVASSENSTSIAVVVPILKELELHLTEVNINIVLCFKIIYLSLYFLLRWQNHNHHHVSPASFLRHEACSNPLTPDLDL